jgi:hypothetical protein
MIRLPVLAGGVAIYLVARWIARRRRRAIVRLRDGGRVRLLSSVALLDGSGSGSDLLALEYVSALATPDPEELRMEARSILQTVGARSEYARCRTALVTPRQRGQRRADPAPRELTFSFHRGDPGSDWYPAEGVE